VDRHDYDLVLMDIQMPNMDGLEATRRIRERHAARPRIIAMTAHVFEEDRLAAINAGMTGLIAKPLRASELSATLTDVMH
jgi:CheY-like chemotaxis protein